MHHVVPIYKYWQYGRWQCISSVLKLCFLLSDYYQTQQSMANAPCVLVSAPVRMLAQETEEAGLCQSVLGWELYVRLMFCSLAVQREEFAGLERGSQKNAG